MREIDIIGKKYGRLTPLKFSHSVGYSKYYLCQCDCGRKKTIYKGSLLTGRTLSCGCFQKERASEANSLPSDDVRRLHLIWAKMRNRCYNPKSNRYYRYGARGISMCDEWLNSKDAFTEWALSHGYKDKLTIDRIDNDGNYCPENCRWITNAEQLSNISTNVIIEYNGESKTLSEWADSLGMKRTTLHNRINYYNWSIEKALTTPVRPY